MTKRIPRVTLSSKHNIYELAYEISNLDHRVVKAFIKELDELMEDYDFTKSLRDYFVKEIENEDA